MSTLSERLRAHSDIDFDGLFRESADELDRLTARVALLEDALMKACGDDAEMVAEYIESQRTGA